jgi:hypothetical protein
MLSNTLTGNSGGPVSPSSGNINLVGQSPIAVTGDIGTSTLTISQSGAVADSFVTQSGTATPSAGVLTIDGSNGITTSGAGSTVTITAGSTIAQSYITDPATGTAVPSSGVITFAAGTNTTITAAGSSITVASTGGGSGPTYSTGTFTPTFVIGGTPFAGPYSVQFGAYTQVGSIVFYNISLATASGATSGTIAINGLPITPSAVKIQPNSMFSPVLNANSGSGTVKYPYVWMVIANGPCPVFYSIFGGSVNGQLNCSNTPGGAFSMDVSGFYFI